MLTMQNEVLTVRVDPLGAELKSLYAPARDMEYMWQPGAEIWDHSSLLLFPNPGRISRDRILVDGKVYPAAMHGFAKDRTFRVTEQAGSRLTLELEADEETMQTFPYRFCLRVTFSLEGDTLRQKLEVENRDGREMYFSIGAHPGFYLPLVLGESGNDYILQFDCPQHIDRLLTQSGSMLLRGERTPYLRGETDILLREDYFNGGPLLLSGVRAQSITLRSLKSGRFVELGIRDFPYMCLWGNPAHNAVICIEPWCGMSDAVDTDHIWEHKPGIEHVSPGQTFARVLTYRVG